MRGFSSLYISTLPHLVLTLFEGYTDVASTLVGFCFYTSDSGATASQNAWTTAAVEADR